MSSEIRTNRRNFMSGSLAAASIAAAPSISRAQGANNKIRMGFIGTGNRGTQLMRLFMREPEIEVAALCDVYKPYMLRDFSQVAQRIKDELGGRIPKMGEKFTKQPKLYDDYRKLLEDKDIDAVCIATPDHWHALMTIDAVNAGKDVYVEKPLTATIVEGRRMVDAQKRTGRVVAVGLNRRGNPAYRQLAEKLHAGKLGELTIASAARISNMYPNGIGRQKPADPPPGFNWDMWLGPRAFRPYQYNIAPYKFRWYNDFSSQMGNWGVHYMDVIRWMMQERAPAAITAHGTKFIDHDADITDTMCVTFEFASGRMIDFKILESCGGPNLPYGEIVIRGSKGVVYADEKGYQIIPSRPGQFQHWKKQVEKEEYNVKEKALADGSSSVSTGGLIHDFVECVKSRNTPLCPLEEGHRSTSFAHLANIAVKVKQRLEWDVDKERFTNSNAANELLHYEYRKPWKLG
ncbi:MAG: Gfo/Idh/MocA family oxidoreductase [Kiritimatiellia bacterium]